MTAVCGTVLREKDALWCVPKGLSEQRIVFNTTRSKKSVGTTSGEQA